MPIKIDKDLPSTLQKSDDKAKRTWAEAADSAEEEYGDGERSRRVAWSALKHTHEKVGDHWEPKKGGRKGPSDPQAKQSTPPLARQAQGDLRRRGRGGQQQAGALRPREGARRGWPLEHEQARACQGDPEEAVGAGRGSRAR